MIGFGDPSGDPSTDILYGSYDPTASLNIGVPSVGAGAVPAMDGSSFPISGSSNPNPTGDWMSVATSIANSAQKAFSSYVQSSPSVAVPRPRTPATATVTLPSISTTSTGGLLLIAGLVAGLGYLVWSHTRRG